MASYPRAALLAVPYARRELPGWGKLLGWLKVSQAAHDGLWADAPTREAVGKWHGYRIRLDLSNWSDRLIYFLGRYYDLPPQLAVRAVLRPGDGFVDVGAHAGMVMLAGAGCVGPSGRTIAFEPNPELFAKLEQLVIANALDNVTLHPCGLADAANEGSLNVLVEKTAAGAIAHANLGTFAELPEREGYATQRFRVAVASGDELIPADCPVAAIKIDTEGYNTAVLRGLGATLARWRPAVVTEVVDAHLRRAGSSATELWETMTDCGDRAYAIAVRSRWGRHQVRFHLTGAASSREVLWLHPESVAYARVAGAIVAP